MSNLPDTDFRRLHDDLKNAHSEVRKCLREMEAITSKSELDRVELTSARFRISKASLSRRTIASICLSALAGCRLESAKTVLESLRRLDLSMRARSATHVAHWTADRIEADWWGYCRASHELRNEMGKQLITEATMLFPLLVANSLAANANALPVLRAPGIRSACR